MWNAMPIQLREQSVFINELTIGEAMQIAKIPENLHELRLNSFIGFVCKDNNLAFNLTVQERYFILLNYLALNESEYNYIGDTSNYMLDDTPIEPIDFTQIDGVYIHHLYGSHATVLQQSCENVYEWLCGQIAFQLSGDLTKYFDKDTPVVWEKIETNNDRELTSVLNERFSQIENLTDSQFSSLIDLFYTGENQLKHLVEISLDNQGITLYSQDIKEGGERQVARFHTFSALSDISQQLAKCLS